MVTIQLKGRGIRDPRVLDAMLAVPRHRFIPPGEANQAYEDRPLPIGEGQTISQPYIVAYMLQALALDGHERVLEIGTGSGYQAALLGRLAREVHSIERHETLAKAAAKILDELSITNVMVHHGDGTKGWPEQAPYEAIIVAASAPVVPQPLLQQLSDSGRLILPVGVAWGQILQLWRRQGDAFDYEELVPVAFVPLIGEHGWGE
ncbi:MAG: protein-L-isoaspartate(D-aspartate) O-methyltransferase [Chloroflexi bacterium]|nr:protein-L-isoaspartate(D-aspartate) O-methyltransferase [Chloroflexota bacterium]